MCQVPRPSIAPHPHFQTNPSSKILCHGQEETLVRNPAPSLEKGSAPAAPTKGKRAGRKAGHSMQSKFKYQYLPPKALSDGRAALTSNCPASRLRRDVATSLLRRLPGFAGWVHPQERTISLRTPGTTPPSPSLLMHLLSPFASQTHFPSRCQG